MLAGRQSDEVRAGVIHLREETPEDWWEVEALLDLCFAPGREALRAVYGELADCLREGRSFVPPGGG